MAIPAISPSDTEIMTVADLAAYLRWHPTTSIDSLKRAKFRLSAWALTGGFDRADGG